jgi:protein-S-isoprenylcysteine O-methyltransferase Ste14
MDLIYIFVFGLSSLALVYISRASLLHPRSHGFYRFIAWEAILAGVIFNLDGWFHDPLSWHQLISWPLLMISLYLLLHSLVLLKRSGRQDARRTDAPLLEFEKTTTLVTTGIYRYIRHPMYSSLLFLAWGIFFKSPSWLDILIVLVATLALVATARSEEAEDLRFFGTAYREYMGRSKRFIPFVF